MSPGPQDGNATYAAPASGTLHNRTAPSRDVPCPKFASSFKEIHSFVLNFHPHFTSLFFFEFWWREENFLLFCSSGAFQWNRLPNKDTFYSSDKDKRTQEKENLGLPKRRKGKNFVAKRTYPVKFCPTSTAVEKEEDIWCFTGIRFPAWPVMVTGAWALNEWTAQAVIKFINIHALLRHWLAPSFSVYHVCCSSVCWWDGNHF